VAPNDAVNVSIDLSAPDDGGTYKGYFKLRAPDGTVFGIGDNAGGAFWVEIESIEEEASSIPELTRNLKLTSPYMQGDDVKTLQKRLLDLGYDVVEKADGIFGPKTDKGVREFQDDEGLTVDGIVGQKTWKALWE
jgi:peptidoglycan hydrolase-like protein with peptidoglycan-binding domain